MSRLSLLLLLSGSLNAGALVAWLGLRPSSPPPATAARATAPVDSAPPATLDAPVWTELAATLVPDPAAPPALPDAAFVARLRAEGFPIEIIRAILRQQLDDHFAEREAAIVAAHPAPPYWTRRYGTDASYRDSGPERIALRNEKRALLRTLLGDEAESPDERARRLRDYGAIPVEKVEALIALNTDYDHRHHELRNAAGGLALPIDRATIEALRAERRHAVAELLTPDELATYDLHSGDTATDLRTKLRWFRPTEDEFLTLYTLQADLEAAHPMPAFAFGMMSEEVQALRAQRAAAAAELEADIAAQLGPERFADYQLVASSTYKQMRDLTDRLDLPVETASSLTRSFDGFAAQAQALLATPAGDPSAQAAQIQALRTALFDQLPADLPLEARAAVDRAAQLWAQSRLRLPRPAPRP